MNRFASEAVIIAPKKKEKVYVYEKKVTKDFSGTFYRTCSQVDLLDLKQVKVAVDKKEGMIFIDESTILSTYEGHTIFSIFLHHFDVFQQILS